MNWTVVVGIIIAIMFLTSFTEWFYHLIAGTNALIAEDSFVGYSIFRFGLSGMLFIVGMFWILAMFYECPTPEEDREGVFVYMDCSLYRWVNNSPLGAYIPKPVDEMIDEEAGKVEEEAPTYTGK